MRAAGDVVGRWLFSHAEDGARVYRPREDEFAPSRRPRDGFDINKDGTFRAYTPGRNDASTASFGRWTRGAGGRLEVAFADGGTRVLDIVAAEAGFLKILGGE